jgi:hypothetical protein
MPDCQYIYGDTKAIIDEANMSKVFDVDVLIHEIIHQEKTHYAIIPY